MSNVNNVKFIAIEFIIIVNKNIRKSLFFVLEFQLCNV